MAPLFLSSCHSPYHVILHIIRSDLVFAFLPSCFFCVIITSSYRNFLRAGVMLEMSLMLGEQKFSYNSTITVVFSSQDPYWFSDFNNSELKISVIIGVSRISAAGSKSKLRHFLGLLTQACPEVPLNNLSPGCIIYILTTPLLNF